MKNGWEAKQEARRERLLRRADRERQLAQDRREASDRAVAGIPFGQPILVGHHSEGRHRRALERSQNAMFKSLEHNRNAAEYEHRAQRVGKGGISSDDPEATEKLTDKVTKLEAIRDRMKAINTAWRKAGKPGPDDLEGWEKITKALSEDPEKLAPVRLDMARQSWHPQPFPTYALTNIGARIRDAKARAARLEMETNAEPAETITGNGYTIEEHPEENRIWITFDAVPSKEIRQSLKQSGLKWSPNRAAWIRMLNNSGRAAMGHVRNELDRLTRKEV